MKKFFTLIILICFSASSQTFDNSLYDDFLKKHVSEKGVVDYDKVLKNIDQINKITANFSKISPNKSWSSDETKAFWINVYNANVIKLLADNYPLKSVNYIRDPFQMNFISFDGEKISLDYIKKEILSKFGDPRTHFALYDTSISSPRLRNIPYDPATLQTDLNFMTTEFVNNPAKNAITAKNAAVSKIFEWYITDFLGTNSIVSFINTFSMVKINDDTKITFLEYNWNLHKI